jgi:hypothetical protein
MLLTCCASLRTLGFSLGFRLYKNDTEDKLVQDLGFSLGFRLYKNDTEDKRYEVPQPL